MIARRRIGTKDRPRCGHASNAGRAAGASGRDMLAASVRTAPADTARAGSGAELAESLLGRGIDRGRLAQQQIRPLQSEVKHMRNMGDYSPPRMPQSRKHVPSGSE